MDNPKCASCGARMKENGKTSAGRQRWRCASCGASSVRRIDGAAKVLAYFPRWLFSKDAIAGLKTSRSTFWRKARHGLNGVVKAGTLFTFIEMRQELGGEWPNANNAIESFNARLREMFGLHRGRPLLHRIKVVFW